MATPKAYRDILEHLQATDLRPSVGDFLGEDGALTVFAKQGSEWPSTRIQTSAHAAPAAAGRKGAMSEEISPKDVASAATASSGLVKEPAAVPELASAGRVDFGSEGRGAQYEEPLKTDAVIKLLPGERAICNVCEKIVKRISLLQHTKHGQGCRGAPLTAGEFRAIKRVTSAARAAYMRKYREPQALASRQSAASGAEAGLTDEPRRRLQQPTLAGGGGGVVGRGSGRMSLDDGVASTAALHPDGGKARPDGDSDGEARKRRSDELTQSKLPPKRRIVDAPDGGGHSVAATRGNQSRLLLCECGISSAAACPCGEQPVDIDLSSSDCEEGATNRRPLRRRYGTKAKAAARRGEMRGWPDGAAWLRMDARAVGAAVRRHAVAARALGRPIECALPPDLHGVGVAHAAGGR
jgi:hypothetical protein